MDIAQFAGYLNIFAGVFLVAALGLFFGGLLQWIAHFGLPHRDEGVAGMSKGVSVLFFLVVLLAAVRTIQYHQQIVLQILVVVGIIFGGWAVLWALKAAQNGGDDDH